MVNKSDSKHFGILSSQADNDVYRKELGSQVNSKVRWIGIGIGILYTHEQYVDYKEMQTLDVFVPSRKGNERQKSDLPNAIRLFERK